MSKRLFLVIFIITFFSFKSVSQKRFEIDSVSVCNSICVIAWYKMDTSDIDSVKIGYALPNGDTDSIGVAQADNFFFTDIDVNTERSPNDSIQTFRVTSYGYDLGASPWGNRHNTIFLEYEFDWCTSEITLSWNKYNYWPELVTDDSGVDYYKIYAVVNDDTNYVSQVEPAEIAENLEYTFQLEDGEASYKFYVRAFGFFDNTSTSNVVSMDADVLIPPDTLIGNYASVTADNFIELSFEIDQDADIEYYKLLRSEKYNEDYDSVKYIYHSQISDSLVTFIDSVDYVDIKYYYMLIAVNECQLSIDTSNVTGNIVLTTIANEDQTDSLIWTLPVPNSNDTYYFTRIRNVANDSVTDSPLMINVTEYSDDISSFTYDRSDGKFCYYIEGICESNSNYHYYSNTSCVIQSPLVYMPNAFTPDGKGPEANNTFYPIISYASEFNYQMIIYNRWGELVFETTEKPTNDVTDPTGKWDGTYLNQGKPVKPGVYIYYINYSNAQKRSITITGHVTVIYP